jgi:hypothetical protein
VNIAIESIEYKIFCTSIQKILASRAPARRAKQSSPGAGALGLGVEKIERRRCDTDPENVSCVMLIQEVLSKMRSAPWAHQAAHLASQSRSLEHFQHKCRPLQGGAGL